MVAEVVPCAQHCGAMGKQWKMAPKWASNTHVRDLDGNQDSCLGPVEQLALQLTPVWDAIVTSGSFTCYATILAPNSES